MKQSEDQTQTLQILYELSLSIGTDPDLQKMFKNCLKTFLKKLNCVAGGVYQLQPNGEEKMNYTAVCTIPQRTKKNSTYQTALSQLPVQADKTQVTQFQSQLPITDQHKAGNYYHLLDLPDFGIMILVKNDEKLSHHLLKSLQPVLKKLTTAAKICQPTITHEKQPQPRTILESVTLPLLIFRQKDDQILYTNEQGANFIGLAEDDLIGQQVSDFYHNSADHQKVLKIIQEQGKVDALELQIKRTDGQLLWALISSRTLRYEDEPAIITTFVDITRRKEAESLANKRAIEMETVSNVSAFATTILEIDKLLQTVVDLTKDRFGLYHAHIYLLNELDDMLDLTAGAGNVGRQMVAEKRHIPLTKEKSLVAQAARTQQGVIENNVKNNPTFLPHPLLPETHAEMAVPMLVGDQLIGVLDVQENQPDSFTQHSINIYTTLAAQIGVALQNARSFAKAQKSLEETEALLDITKQASRFLESANMLETILDKVLATTKFEIGLITVFDSKTDSLQLAAHRLPKHIQEGIEMNGLDDSLCDLVFRGKETIVVTDLASDAPVDVTGMVNMGYQSYQGVPLKVLDEVVGTLCIFCSERLTLEQANIAFLQAVGQQIGNAIRYANLFEQAEIALEEAKHSEDILVKQAVELNELTRRLTREGWADHMSNHSSYENGKGYIFDGTMVHEAVEGEVATEIEPSFVQPIKVRGVSIGQLALVPEEADEDINEVVDIVMKQLGAHIENLRLTEQSQMALAETEALYIGSERIVLSATEDDILRALIQSTVLKNLDHANIFMFDAPVEDSLPRDVTVVANWENEGAPATVSLGTRFSVAQVPFMSLLKPGETVVISDIWQDDRVDAQTRQVLEGFGMSSFAFFPMVVGNQWLGLVAGQSAQPLILNDAQLRRVTSLVGQAAVVMRTTILYRQEQARARREQVLREIAAKVRSSADVDTIMRTAVTEIGRALGRPAMVSLNNQSLSEV